VQQYFEQFKGQVVNFIAVQKLRHLSLKEGCNLFKGKDISSTFLQEKIKAPNNSLNPNNV
jgi:hypothetical protein